MIWWLQRWCSYSEDEVQAAGKRGLRRVKETIAAEEADRLRGLGVGS